MSWGRRISSALRSGQALTGAAVGITLEQGWWAVRALTLLGLPLTAALLMLTPPTEHVGDAGWSIAAAQVGYQLINLALLSRASRPPSQRWLTASLCGSLALLIPLVWVTGGFGSPFELYAAYVILPATVLAPRAIALLIAVALIVLVAPLAYDDVDNAAVASNLMLFVVVAIGTVGLRSVNRTIHESAKLQAAESARARSELAEARAKSAEASAEAAISQAEYAAAKDVAARLGEVDEIKDRMVSSVSHELRTPLTSIKGFLGALLEGDAGELTAEQREYLEVVDRNAERLQELVSHLLVLSQAETGGLGLELTEFDLSEQLRLLSASFRAPAEAEGAELVARIAPGIVIRGDAERLERACGNLISNAIKYGAAGGTVTVDVRSEEHVVIVEVGDHGVGIPADELSRVGERFFRASTAAAASGSGLGLAVVRQIVGLHGGRLEVESEVGSGSTFRLRIPVAGPTHPRGRASGSGSS